MASITIDPVTRIEGHLSIHVETESGKVTSARLSGEMFRGFETLLLGRQPTDAQQIVQRICGVCPISHGLSSTIAQDAAYKVTPPKNGQLLRKLILGANFIQSHILHFYHLAALDFVDIKAVAQYKGNDVTLADFGHWVKSQSQDECPAPPFLPRYEGRYIEDGDLNLQAASHYLEALEMRTLAHRMAALFAGKMPHAASLMPGGVTETVTTDKIAAYASMLRKLQAFIEYAYLPDVLAVAKTFPEYFQIGRGCGSFLSYGAFADADGGSSLLPAGVLAGGELQALDLSCISEDVKSSLYSSPSGLAPSQGLTVPQPGKSGAYSWLKAPRYSTKVVEVGPLARLLVGYKAGKNTELQTAVDETVKALKIQKEDLVSVMGRHAARAIECKLVADGCAVWLDGLRPGEPSFVDYEIPQTAAGVGLVEAPRGSLGHWIEIRNRKISQYQCVVPTTWNCSPRDDRGNPGAVEQALVGTPVADPAHPLEATRVVRSFDPCIGCAVH